MSEIIKIDIVEIIQVKNVQDWRLKNYKLVISAPQNLTKN